MFIKTHTVLNDLHHAARVCIFVVTDVWVAVQRGDAETVERLLHAVPTGDINALDSKGTHMHTFYNNMTHTASACTPMVALLTYGRTCTHLNLTEVHTHIRSNVRLINVCLSLSGNSLLHYATRRPHAAIALSLLSRGANPNLRSSNELREPALHGAIVTNDIALVQQLVGAHGADIHAGNAKGYNALMTAVQFKRFLLAAYFLRCGAHANAVDSDSHTALHWAAYVGHQRLTRLLINYNADATRQDDRGMTALHWAAAKGFIDVVDELTTPARGNDAHTEVDVYAQMKARDQQGLLAVELARKNKHVRVADYMDELRRVIYGDNPFVSAKFSLVARALCMRLVCAVLVSSHFNVVICLYICWLRLIPACVFACISYIQSVLVVIIWQILIYVCELDVGAKVSAADIDCGRHNIHLSMGHALQLAAG